MLDNKILLNKTEDGGTSKNAKTKVKDSKNKDINKEDKKAAEKKAAEKKAAEKKAADKKAAEKKAAEKKAAEKKAAEKKAAEKKAAEKKAAEKKAAEKKAAEKKAADKKAADKKKTDSKNDNDTEKKSGKKFNLKYLGGLLFAKMMKGGASELRANAEEVNKLNVFPVPDGDTGDNMSMTIDSGIAAIEDNDSDDLAEVIMVLSRGMLLGARGNSGVILSQFFAGIAKGFKDSNKADPLTLGNAFKQGVEQAYTSVMTPTEGTILTVMREAVDFAVSKITPKSTIRTLFSDLANEMHASLERTPEILPVLKEAGVVDSGGAGLYYIIDGLNRVLNGEDIPDIALPSDAVKAPKASIGSFGPDSVMTYGYCTELLLQLQRSKCDIDSFDVDALKAFLAELGDSIVCFKTDSIVKLHVHTFTPEKVFEYCRKFGEFLTVKVENMSVQHTELKTEEEEKPKEKKKYGMVAVSNGPGIESLFIDLGCDRIVEGGQTNNPSTSDFLKAFEAINAEHIFVFPNNGNIVMAATQAAEIYTEAKVHVIGAKTIGAGYVALSSMNFDSSSPEELIAEADEAISRITSGYISPAVRDADLNGIHVSEGDTIGIINKEIVVSESDRLDACKKLVDKLLSEDAFMLTVFTGADAKLGERAVLEAYVTKNYPAMECYFIDGGQDIYPYMFVAE